MMVPAAHEIVERWGPSPSSAIHDADCWKAHPHCAIARVYGEMLIEVERLTVERDQARESVGVLMEGVDRLTAELDEARSLAENFASRVPEDGVVAPWETS